MQDSDAVKIVTLILAAFTGIATPVVGVVVTWYLWKLKDAQEKAATLAARIALATADKAAATAQIVAVKVSEVKQALVATDAVRDAKLDVLQDTTHATHILVNSQMGTALHTAATALRALADIQKTPASIQAAEAAEAKLAEHGIKQAAVDAAAAAPRTTFVVVQPVAPPPRPLEVPGDSSKLVVRKP